MSQRLLICEKASATEDDKKQMDAIYTEESSLEELLKWVCYHKKYFSGTIKLIIRDYKLLQYFDYDLNTLAKIIHQIRGYEYFWSANYIGKGLEYPTRRVVFDMVKEHMHQAYEEMDALQVKK